MELIVLGSGTVAPTPERTAPAHWVTAGPVRLLLDCGSGTLHRAAQHDVPWPTVTHIALTHFHVDHWGELSHFLFALRWGTEPTRTDPLTIIGPLGLIRRFRALTQAFGEWLEDPGYPIDLVEMNPLESRELGTDVLLETCKTPHTDESLAYAVRHRGARLVYTGDTGPSAGLASWARNCDLLLTEASLPEDRAVEIHLTPEQAGQLARDSLARRLVLVHFYPPVETTDPAGAAARYYSGPVSAARDGDLYTIGD